MTAAHPPARAFLTTRIRSKSTGEVALAAMTLAVVAWSFGPVFVREIGASTPTIAFWRMLAAQPVMIGAAYLAGGRLSLPLLRRCVWPGVLFALSLVTSFASYQHTSIANATLIGALQPAAILVVAPRLFGDRSTPRQLAAATAAFAGMVVVVLGAGKTSGAGWLGDLYAVANLAIWTVYYIRVKRVRNEGLHAPSFLAGVFLVAWLVLTPWALLVSGDLGSVSARGFGFVIAMALGPGLLGHGLSTWAQRHLDISVSSLVTLLQPVLSTLSAWWLYDERLVPIQLAGALVVLVGLAGIMWESRRPAAVEVGSALSVALDPG